MNCKVGGGVGGGTKHVIHNSIDHRCILQFDIKAFSGGKTEETIVL
jgi:hypothetical protein